MCSGDPVYPTDNTPQPRFVKNEVRDDLTNSHGMGSGITQSIKYHTSNNYNQHLGGRKVTVLIQGHLKVKFNIKSNYSPHLTSMSFQQHINVRDDLQSYSSSKVKVTHHSNPNIWCACSVTLTPCEVTWLQLQSVTITNIYTCMPPPQNLGQNSISRSPWLTVTTWLFTWWFPTG